MSNCIDNWHSALISNLLSRLLKQKLTFSRAGSTVLLRYLFQSRLYLSVGVETELVDEVVQSVAREVVLHLAEDGFDWVEGRGVAYVVHWQDVQLPVCWLD